MVIEIDPKKLKALLLFSAVEDARYYLNGVYFNPRLAFACASDGHTALKVAIEMQDIEPFIIAAPQLILAMKGYNFKTIGVEYNEGMISVNGFSFKPIDGKYPDIYKVMPEMSNPLPSPAIYLSEYISRTHKALTLLTSAGKFNGVRFMFDGGELCLQSPYDEIIRAANNGCGYIRTEDFTLIVMPTR